MGLRDSSNQSMRSYEMVELQVNENEGQRPEKMAALRGRSMVEISDVMKYCN